MQIHLLTGGTQAVQKYVQHKAIQKQQVPSDEGTCFLHEGICFLHETEKIRQGAENTGGEQEMSDQRKVTQRLLDGSRDLWDAYLEHPFVQGIADGTLDREKFRFYMIQDYLYLIEYAKVFALGVAKAKDLESMRLFAGYVKQILDGEMDIHRGYMARLGISLADAEKAQTALDNRSYTAYMLQVGYEEGAAQIAVSILSCALSYEHIARRMLEKYPEADRHPFYGEWVKGYACEEYHEANEELIELTERLCENMNEPQLRHLEEIFHICSRYEMSFWDMAWEIRG